MAELNFIVMAGGVLRPEDDDTAERVKKWGYGNLITGKFSRPRNYKFLQKFHVMINVGFEAWEPAVDEYKGMPVQKNRERFREDCIIAAGYWEPMVNLKGDIRARAKSISYANMDETDFGELYNAVQKVILDQVLKNYTKEDLDNVVAEMMNFL